ncbi:MAG: hypothetical protein DME60_06165 [Verrucomicrobia bacterium]|nr:MAG: hypothetical protein DME60_06165 [Verrucomicrobiota bacterium]
MRWYWNSENGNEEAAKFQKAFPTLALEFERNTHSACVRGVLPITPNIGYTVSLKLPSNYPKGIPTLWIARNEIPWLADRHINEASGEGCLCVRSEYRLHWPIGSDLATFIDRLVRPYFAAQLFYETHGYWPKNAARSHGKDGIIEAYRELSIPFGNDSSQIIENLMRLLARKGPPKGHELCPCGSGLRLRNCHFDVLQRLRNNIAPEHAKADLEMMFPSIPRENERRDSHFLVRSNRMK